MNERLEALRSSVDHLRHVVEDVEAFEPELSAFPTEWSVADTMSHIGSGAVILLQRLEDTLDLREPAADFNQGVWDEWNAKSPSDQVNDALVADEELLLALVATTEEEREAFHFTMGPFELDFDGFVGLRLNEQALHTWDVEVAVDPSATLSEQVAGAIIDNLQFIIRFAGKAKGEVKELGVRTTHPTRDFTLVFADESISMGDAAHTGPADFEIPAETFVRLVYGRVDAQNTPAGLDQFHLESLKNSFHGV